MPTNHARIPRSTAAVCAAGVVAAVALGRCGGSSTTVGTVYPYDEAYTYAAYYPADVVYAGDYWADDWNYSTIYYYFVGALPLSPSSLTGSRDGGLDLDGGSTASPSATGVSGAIEALARGMPICPGQVTVTPKTSPPVCQDGAKAEQRSGVTIVFNGCGVGPNQIDGMVDVTTVRSASDAVCAPTTTIMATTTVTVTGLSVRQNNGAGILVPSHTSTITASYPYKQNERTLTATGSGEIEIFDSAGRMTADLTEQGNETYTLPGAQSYSVDGTQTISDPGDDATSTVTKMGVIRSGDCCRPTGGAIVVNRTGGAAPGIVTWQFGPACGDALRNGTKVTLVDCLQ